VAAEKGSVSLGGSDILVEKSLSWNPSLQGLPNQQAIATVLGDDAPANRKLAR
jgi:hypothetical protein